jgi:hypothetical protein
LLKKYEAFYLTFTQSLGDPISRIPGSNAAKHLRGDRKVFWENLHSLREFLPLL